MELKLLENLPHSQTQLKESGFLDAGEDYLSRLFTRLPAQVAQG